MEPDGNMHTNPRDTENRKETAMETEHNRKVFCESDTLSIINFSGNEMSIRDFYKDAVIFITGATGFVGKVLIEKLLRTCTDVKTIYIHVRSKRGAASDLRYKELIKHEIFNRLKATNKETLNKLICVAGDMTQERLGLSNKDMQMILQNVTIVFHIAATVKFNEPLKNAGNLNAYGTCRLMEMCTKMSELKSFVHVSTAYCNPGRKHVGETVYPSSSPLDKDCFMKSVQILPAEVLDSILDTIRGPHPNSYTLTKSIAELIVAEYSEQFSVSIVRPSIITGSLSEPYPGWVDNIQGITGIMMEIGRGTIKSIFGDGKLACDIIPVDIVVNTMIGAAWRGYIRNEQRTNVYNCTSGQLKPIKWEQLGLYTQKWARRYPSKYQALYPHFKYTTNRKVHQFYETCYHMFPAFLYDLVARFQGYKPIMMKMAKKLQTSCEIGKFFVLHEWIFENKNQQRLAREVKATNDGNLFVCDINDMNYDTYVRNFMLGIRKYVLKDDETSLPDARRKLLLLFWLRNIFHLGLVVLFVYVFISIFKKLLL